MRIKEWLREKLKPETTTLVHYILFFCTVDGEKHMYSGMNFIDPGSIRCGALEYYLIGKEYLKDDEGVRYPMSNIHSIWAEPKEIIKNVKVNDYKVWYSAEDIEVVKE